MRRWIAATVLLASTLGASVAPALAGEGEDQDRSRRTERVRRYDRDDDRYDRSDRRDDRDSGRWTRRRTLNDRVESLRWQVDKFYRKGELSRYRRDQLLQTLDRVSDQVRDRREFDDYYFRTTLRRLDNVEDLMLREAQAGSGRGGVRRTGYRER
jgi:hypothetical protein